MRFVPTLARFAQGLALAEIAADPYPALHVSYAAAADLRDMSPDDSWKTPPNAFRGAFLAWSVASPEELPQRRRELAAAGRAVLALPWPPQRENASEVEGA